MSDLDPAPSLCVAFAAAQSFYFYSCLSSSAASCALLVPVRFPLLSADDVLSSIFFFFSYLCFQAAPAHLDAKREKGAPLAPYRYPLPRIERWMQRPAVVVVGGASPRYL